MKKLLAIVLILLSLNAYSQNTTTIPTSPAPVSFTPSFRWWSTTGITDSLRQVWMQTPGGGWNRLFTATEARLRFAPLAGSNNYIQNQYALPQSANAWINGNFKADGTLTVGTDSYLGSSIYWAGLQFAPNGGAWSTDYNNIIVGQNSSPYRLSRVTMDNFISHYNLASNAITYLDSLPQLASYNGPSKVMYLRDSTKGGGPWDKLPKRTYYADGGIRAASNSADSLWFRRLDGTPLSKWYSINNNADSTLINFAGSYIRQRDVDMMNARLGFGVGVRIAALGNSIATGIGQPGSLSFGITNGVWHPSFATMFALAAMSSDMNFMPPNPNNFLVIPAQNPLGIGTVGLGSDFDKLPVPLHLLRKSLNSDLTWPTTQNGIAIKDSITIYYLERTSSEAAIFDVIIDGVTYTIDTYVPSSGGDPSFPRLASITYRYAPARTKNIRFNNVRTIDRGSGTPATEGAAAIVGMAFGSGVFYTNLAVSSTTLKNTSAGNSSRGVTTDERFDKAFAFNSNVYIVEWGTNDSKAGVSTIPAYKAALRYRIKQIRTFKPSSVIILVGVGAGDGQYVNNIVYNRAMREVAIETNCSFFDAQSIFTSSTRLINDDVHPNLWGHEGMGAAMAKAFGFTPVSVLPYVKPVPTAVDTTTYDARYIKNTSTTGIINPAGAASIGYSNGLTGSSKLYVIDHPVGGAYTSGSGSAVGSIKIQLPTQSSNAIHVMLKGRIYYPATQSSSEFFITCNPSDMSSYAQAIFTGGPGFNVRFNNNGSSPIIYIGELAQAWGRLGVTIDQVMVKYTDASVLNYKTGWTVGVEPTAFTGTLATTVLQANSLPSASLATSLGVNRVTTGGTGTATAPTAGQIPVATNTTTYTPTTLSGDATVNSTGVVALAATGTAGTYKSVTTDAKGRVTAGTNPNTLAGYGITDAAGLSTANVFTNTNTFKEVRATGTGISIADGMGVVNVTQQAGSNYASYGLTRVGNYAAAIGLSTTNQLIFGTGPTRGINATIDTSIVEFDLHLGGMRLKNYLNQTLFNVNSSGNVKATLPAYSSGTSLPVVYNSTNDRFETSTTTTRTSVTSSASTLTLVAGTDYTYTGGSTATWTLPTIASTTPGGSSQISVKNHGGGALGIVSGTGNEVSTTSSGANFGVSIPVLGMSILLPDSAYWNEFKSN